MGLILFIHNSSYNYLISFIFISYLLKMRFQKMLFTEFRSIHKFQRYLILKKYYIKTGLNIFMCLFHVNGPNQFGDKSIGFSLKSHLNIVMVSEITANLRFRGHLTSNLHAVTLQPALRSHIENLKILNWHA